MSSLHTLLDRAQSFAPEYAGRLSNHLPMALVALHALGANEQQMERGFINASRRLEPAPPDAEHAHDWQVLRGQPDAFAAVRARFIQEISAHGASATLRAALPALMDGVGGNAFHGLIRTAAAVIAIHHTELASGLAHWACSHMPLASPQPVNENDVKVADIRSWLANLSTATTGWKSGANLIADRRLSYSQTSAFQHHCQRLVVDDSSLRELASIALEHYLQSRNFTVLHLITATHAMRILSPYFNEPLMAVRHYAIAFAAGVAASGIDAGSAALPFTPKSWDTLKIIACNADDEHVIKLIYACQEEFRTTNDDRYRLAASLVTR
jgi:Questin oxidase-like